MTPLEAWHNIGKRLKIYAQEHGYTGEDIEAEVFVFSILNQLEKEMKEGGEE